jgi:serine protease inhibitor
VIPHGAARSVVTIGLLLAALALALAPTSASSMHPPYEGAIFNESTSSSKAAQVPSPTAASPHKALAPAAATAAFGLDLIRAGAPANLVLSPDSVAAALAMTGTGAAGRTATQMAGTLHLATPAAFPAVGRLQRTIANEQASAGQGHPKAPTLEMANGLFLKGGFPVRPAFLSGLQQHFSAAPEAVDFSGDPAGAVEAINAWVSAHTAGIIPQLLTSLPEETRLALANAIYLKAAWLHPFEPTETSLAPFYTRTGRTSVEFMHETDRLRYGSGRGYAAVELPYRASARDHANLPRSDHRNSPAMSTTPAA